MAARNGVTWSVYALQLNGNDIVRTRVLLVLAKFELKARLWYCHCFVHSHRRHINTRQYTPLCTHMSLFIRPCTSFSPCLAIAFFDSPQTSTHVCLFLWGGGLNSRPETEFATCCLEVLKHTIQLLWTQERRYQTPHVEPWSLML